MTSSNQPRLTKQERREAARAEARRIQEAQERREKRNRILIIVGVVAGVLIVAGVVWAIIANSNRSALEGVNSPEGSNLQGGIPIGSSLAAGTENEGAPTVDIYVDYTCHFCAQFEEINAADVATAAADGDATIWIHPVAILDGTGDYSGYSGVSANAAATVAQYAPDQFLTFSTRLFTLYTDAVSAAQDSGAASVTEPTLADIEAAALEEGVPQDVVDRFADGEFHDWVAATTRQFGRDGYQGTPTIEINDEVFQDWQTPGAFLTAVQAAN